MTHKLSSPIGRMEMEKGVVGSHRSDRDGERYHSTSQMKKGPQAQVTCKPSDPTSQMEMEKGPTGTHDMTCKLSGPIG
jgi:hypothetical protein